MKPTRIKPGHLPPAMTSAQCREALDEYKRTGDRRVRNRVVVGCLQFVASRAKSFGSANRYDELMQVGAIGLITAIEKWNPVREVAFVTYARWWIDAEMLDLVRDPDGAFRLPRKTLGQVRKAYADGHRSADEIAKVTGLDFWTVAALIPRMSGRDVSVHDSEPIDEAPTVYEAAVDAEVSERLRAAIGTLSHAQRETIEARYLRNQRLRDVADERGISFQSVANTERRALERLRRQLREVA